MKKLISLILLIGVLLAGTMSFAEGTEAAVSDNTTAAASTTPNTRAKLSGNLQKFKNFVAEAKPLAQEIRTNRAQLLQMKVESKTAYTAAKSKVKELKKNKDSMSAEKIEALKQAVNTLAADKKQLESTQGNLNTQSLNLKTARQARDSEAYKQALNSIITIQSTRINDLKTVIDDMNKIAGM